MKEGWASGYCWPVDLRMRWHLRCLAQYVGRHLLAGTTVCRYAKLSLQGPQVLSASLSGFADLLVSDSVADADVHTIQYLTCLQAIKTQMRMIVNTIT